MQDHLGEMQSPIFHLQPKPGTNSRGSAQTMVFEGPNQEHLTNVKYTTCGEGIDDWYLNAKDLDIDHYTESVTAKNASVDFMGIPILYTPWIEFPLNKQRESGLLAPTFGISTLNGIEASIPYYWNIAPNRDATFTPRYLSKRGEQLRSEYRYLEDNYAGNANLEILPNDDQIGLTRYFINFNHTQDFGNGWTGNIQFQKVSDGQYFTDMSTQITSTSLVNLPQQISAAYSDAEWHFSALAQRYQTLDNASFTYQRVPQLTLSNTEDFDWITTNTYSEFVNFNRNNTAPAVVNGISVPTGSRFTLYPSVSVPLTASYGYVTPKIGVSYTQYALSDTGGQFGSDSRVLPIFSVDSGMYFDRDMRVVKNYYTQTLEPRLFYVFIPHHDESRLPNFDTALSDLNLSTIFSENQFSGGDRINDANQLTLAVTSRMIDKKTGAERLSATIGQRYYLSDSRVVLPGGTPISGAQSDILTALTAQLSNGWYGDFAWEYNTNRSRTIKSNIATRYQPEPGQVLNLSYRFTKDSLEQIDISSEWLLTGNWYGLGRLNYSLRDHVATAISAADVSGPIEYIAGVEYNAGCWQTRALLQRLATSTPNQANYAFFFQLVLNGFSSIGSNPMDVIKREVTGYTSVNQISTPYNQFSTSP
jgi:LPS-assembly protein